MKYDPFPMSSTLGHMFPHTELTLGPCMVSLDEYLARSSPIKFTHLPVHNNNTVIPYVCTDINTCISYYNMCSRNSYVCNIYNMFVMFIFTYFMILSYYVGMEIERSLYSMSKHYRIPGHYTILKRIVENQLFSLEYLDSHGQNSDLLISLPTPRDSECIPKVPLMYVSNCSRVKTRILDTVQPFRLNHLDMHSRIRF